MARDVDAVESDLIERVWTSPDLWPNMARIAGFPDGRFVGTAGNRAAREFLLDRFRAYGLSDVRTEPFPFTGWRRGPADVEGIPASGDDAPSFRCIALPGSPGTAPAGAVAEGIVLRDGGRAEFERRAGDLAGRHLWVDSSVSEAGPIHRNEKYCRAVNAGAAGFLYVRHLPGQLEETGSVGWQRGGGVGKIPAVALSCEEGHRLRRWIESGAGRVRIRTGCEGVSMEGHQVVGEIPSSKGGNWILVGAHYDGHDISEAAVDNGSGVALMLELARLFVPLTGNLRKGIRFIGFDAEEMGLVGSSAYAEQLDARGELDGVELVLNLDIAVGPDAKQVTVNGVPELGPLVDGLVADAGVPLTRIERIFSASDHFPFLLHGVPGICIEGRGIDSAMGRGWCHTSADTLDKVNERDLRESAMLAARLLYRAATAEGRLVERLPTDAVAAMLREAGKETSLRVQGEWPFDDTAAATR